MDQPPDRPPKPKERIVWFSCRAKPGCPGNQAKVVFTRGTPGQLSVTRYRCLTCGGSWHVKQ